MLVLRQRRTSMSSKKFCDECSKEISYKDQVGLLVSMTHPLYDLEFCTVCFARHWKPGTRRFSLKKKPVEPIDIIRRKRLG